MSSRSSSDIWMVVWCTARWHHTVFVLSMTLCWKQQKLWRGFNLVLTDPLPRGTVQIQDVIYWSRGPERNIGPLTCHNSSTSLPVIVLKPRFEPRKPQRWHRSRWVGSMQRVEGQSLFRSLMYCTSQYMIGSFLTVRTQRTSLIGRLEEHVCCELSEAGGIRTRCTECFSYVRGINYSEGRCLSDAGGPLVAKPTVRLDTVHTDTSVKLYIATRHSCYEKLHSFYSSYKGNRLPKLPSVVTENL